jgi:chromosome segregation ATPase
MTEIGRLKDHIDRLCKDNDGLEIENENLLDKISELESAHEEAIWKLQDELEARTKEYYKETERLKNLLKGVRGLSGEEALAIVENDPDMCCCAGYWHKGGIGCS